MAKKRMVLEIGMGTDIRGAEPTKAACRAVRDALWHNSLSIATALGQPLDAMLVDVHIGVPRPETVDKAEVLAVLQKMIKQRQESVELYDKGGRAELAAQEREEIAIISAYLPKQMSDADVKAAITAAIAETGAAGMKDMGKVVAALKAKYAGQMDFGKASGMVKAALSS